VWLLAGLVALLIVLGGAAAGWYAASRSAGVAAGTATVPATAGTPVSGLATVGVAELQPEARTVLATIDAHGTFGYPQDGTVFGSFEGRLPARPSGYRDAGQCSALQGGGEGPR
jgi:ribonuclease T1